MGWKKTGKKIRWRGEEKQREAQEKSVLLWQQHNCWARTKISGQTDRHKNSGYFSQFSEVDLHL